MSSLSKYVNEMRNQVTNLYAKGKVPEMVALAEKKIRANTNMAAVSKLEERRDGCKEGIDKLALQVEQIAGWVMNNADECTDVGLIDGKRRWLAGYADKAFYAVDRAMFEWMPKRERNAMDGESMNVSTGTTKNDKDAKTMKGGKGATSKGGSENKGAKNNAKATAATLAATAAAKKGA